MGLATLLMNFYSGMELMLRHVLLDEGVTISKSETWHKDLLNKAVEQNIISSELSNEIRPYLNFRHKHIHGYGYMDDWEVIKPLVMKAGETANRFLSEFHDNGYV